MPTETGLSLFDVLKRADPALVDPGLTAQLECTLDEVVLGKQEMIGAIDAVCDVAQRIIGKALPCQPRRREHEAHFYCDDFADRGDIQCGRTATGRLTGRSGIGAINVCAMPCGAERPVALSQSNGTKFFKSRKVAGYDGCGALGMATIPSPQHA